MISFDNLMNEAILLAKEAENIKEVPVGAVIFDEKGEIIGRGFNQKELNKNSLDHAEMISIKEGSTSLSNWRLTGCTMVVTLEPCLMCLSAAIHARVKQIIFGAYDFKYGAISLGHKFYLDGSLNHKIEIIGGVKELENQKILKSFFKRLRGS